MDLKKGFDVFDNCFEEAPESFRAILKAAYYAGAGAATASVIKALADYGELGHVGARHLSHMVEDIASEKNRLMQ